MAEITRRRQGEMLQAVFKVLEKSDGAVAARDVLAQMRTLLPPTDWEQGTYPGAQPASRYDKIVRFSTVAAVKAGWMVKSKGTWTVTQEGLQAMETHPDPEDFFQYASKLYRQWRKAQPQTETAVPEEPTEEEYGSVTLEEAEETARQEITAYLAKMPPYDFQELVAALLRAMGYRVAWVAPPGPDKGLDVLAYTDPLGTSGPRIKVQVKRRQDKIAVQEVRSFVALLGPSDVGIFVSIGGFTSEAAAEARQQESRRVTLLDVAELLDLWVEHYEHIAEASKDLLPLRPIYYLALA